MMIISKVTTTEGGINMQDGKNIDIKLIVFRIEDEEYVLPIDNVGSIEKIESITRVPRTVDFVKGVINLRGVITPVIDLKQRFKQTPIEITEQSRIIIVHIDDIVIGFLVDEANNVIDVDGNLIEETPEVIESQNMDYISGVINLNNRLLVMLDIKKVLEEQTFAEMKKLEESL